MNKVIALCVLVACVVTVSKLTMPMDEVKAHCMKQDKLEYNYCVKELTK